MCIRDRYYLVQCVPVAGKAEFGLWILAASADDRVGITTHQCGAVYKKFKHVLILSMVVFGSFRVSLPLRPQAGPMVLEGTEKKKRLYAQSVSYTHLPERTKMILF